MNQQQVLDLLQQHGIKPTANRMIILKALSASGRPQTMKELEYSILSIDKSGIFRTLQLFRDHHLVHDIEDGDGAIRYELCTAAPGEDDDDEHVHFFCEQCHRIFCFYDTPIPEVETPEGYVTHDVNFLIKGLCPDCAKKRRQSR